MSSQIFFTNKKKAVIFTSCVLGILMTMFFQNCSKNSSSEQQQALDTDLSGVGLLYSSGTLSPDYVFQIKYNVDLRNKSLQIISSKGALVGSSVPSSAQKNITTAQVSQLISLITAVKHKPCSAGVTSSGYDALVTYIKSL